VPEDLWIIGVANLSRKHGGQADDVEPGAYCRFYRTRPRVLAEQSVCYGDRHHPPCCDYRLCRLNPWALAVRVVRTTDYRFSGRRPDEGGGNQDDEPV
jgi:hypothetical protein